MQVLTSAESLLKWIEKTGLDLAQLDPKRVKIYKRETRHTCTKSCNQHLKTDMKENTMP